MKTLVDVLRELIASSDGDDRIGRFDFSGDDLGHLYEVRHWIHDQLLAFETDSVRRHRLGMLLARILAAIEDRKVRMKGKSGDDA